MFIPDPSPVFPACPTYGFSTAPDYLVKFITREGGFERADVKWEEPLHSYSGVPLGNQPQRDIEAVMTFYHGVRKGFPFRFKDWADFKSCRLDDTPAPTDQPVQTIVGSPSGYQLVKTYTAGSLTTIRRIFRPRGPTIRIANAAGIEQSQDTWTVDESTGLLNVLGGFSGVPNSWGGEFDVWCRFDGIPQVTIIDYKIQSATVNLKEKRPEP